MIAIWREQERLEMDMRQMMEPLHILLMVDCFVRSVRDLMPKFINISRGLVNMLTSINEDRPTILRILNTIENKTDTIIDRLNRN
jgi:hypothetical protein